MFEDIFKKEQKPKKKLGKKKLRKRVNLLPKGQTIPTPKGMMKKAMKIREDLNEAGEQEGTDPA